MWFGEFSDEWTNVQVEWGAMIVWLKSEWEHSLKHTVHPKNAVLYFPHILVTVLHEIVESNDRTMFSRYIVLLHGNISLQSVLIKMFTNGTFWTSYVFIKWSSSNSIYILLLNIIILHTYIIIKYL